jgi:hypothetical protein
MALATRMAAVIAQVEPVGAGRAIDRALGQALVHRRGDQQIGAEQVVIAIGPCGGIGREIMPQRARDRLVVGMMAPEQVAKLRDQRLPQRHQPHDRRGRLRIHPRFVDRAIGVPAVDRETRHEDARLHPAQQQFGFGRGPAKPPISCPWLDTPDSARPRPIFWLKRSDSQLVLLSPDHVCA